jgi:hypothetical protein
VVSKVLPTVLMTVRPLAGACHLYQTDAPPELPAWLGSPASLFAPTFVPVTPPAMPVKTRALAKLLLVGPLPTATVMLTGSEVVVLPLLSVARAVRA